MSDLTAYVPRDLDRPDLLDPVTDGWIASIAEVAQLAAYIADTAFVPGPLRGNAPAVAATILYGREIGVAPITALQTMHVVNGRVGMAAELMRARVLAAGHEIEVVESTGAVCRMRGRRRGQERWAEVQWSKGDAQQAGLSGDGWRKYPRAMLVARASAELCRLVFPDVTHGMAATEEIESDTTSTTPAPATPPRKVARAPRAAPAPEPPREVPETPRASPPPEVPEPPPLPEPEHMPGEVPLPPFAEVVEEHGEDHPAPVEVPTVLNPEAVGDPNQTPIVQLPPRVEVIEADPLLGPEADPREQGRLRGDGPATRPQTRHVMALLARLGIGSTRDERLYVGQALVGRRVSSFTELTVTDAGRMITTLLIALDSDDPRAFIRHLVDEEHRRMAEAEAEGGIGDE
jgi:hypothetical protein